MTGGEISKNSLQDGATVQAGYYRVTAANIAVTGTFQKTGGVIKEGTNTSNAGNGASQNHNGIYVQRGFGGNTADNTAVVFRNGEIGENMMLFFQGFRITANNNSDASAGLNSPAGNTTSVPTTTKPRFVPDNWEN